MTPVWQLAAVERCAACRAIVGPTMPTKPLSNEPRTKELRKGSAIVGYTDKIYDIPAEEEVLHIDEIAVAGDLSGELDYNGHRLEVVHIDAAVGLIASPTGLRGPVWQGVDCRIVA
jgi:hypothetical protein